LNDVVYLYGFVPAGTEAAGAPAGVEDAPVEVLAAGAVHAVISRLPAEEYGSGALDARLEDLAWVAERGLGHERVIAWFVDHGEIVPAPLFTLFSSADALAAHAHGRAASIRETLARFAGLREWDVKLGYHGEIVAQHAGEVSAEVHGLDEEIAAATPGKRFLLERKRADIVKREVTAAARRIAGELYDQLSAEARDAVRLPLPQGGAELPVVLNAALLIERPHEAALIATLEAHAARLRPLGIELRFSGPWAAYRFMGDARAP
jgi:hypothetical protein